MAWSDRRQHTGEDLEAEVLFVAEAVLHQVKAAAIAA
jgi:hypothetical protein